MSQIISWLLSLLYPPKCIFCRALLEEQETDCCGACRKELSAGIKPAKGAFFAHCYAVAFYRGTVRDAILRYKFDAMQHYAAPLGRLLAMKLLQEAPEFDVLTWVPISRKRRKERGYDQTQLLAAAVARELGVPCVRTLRKIRNNPAQSSIQGTPERKANVLNVYQAVDSEAVLGKRILLIDDIITTGATLSECGRVLLTAGAAQVEAAVFAMASLDIKNSR